MRTLMKATIPVEAGNKGIADGSLSKIVMAFVEKFKPEASYFTAEEGQRTAYFIFDLKNPADIPSVAESFFMKLNASIELKPVMNLEDMKTGVAKAMGH